MTAAMLKTTTMVNNSMSDHPVLADQLGCLKSCFFMLFCARGRFVSHPCIDPFRCPDKPNLLLQCSETCSFVLPDSKVYMVQYPRWTRYSVWDIWKKQGTQPPLCALRESARGGREPLFSKFGSVCVNSKQRLGGICITFSSPNPANIFCCCCRDTCG